MGGGQPKNLEKNPQSEHEKFKQQAQPTYDAGSRIWTQATLVGGESSNHYTIPAPHLANDIKKKLGFKTREGGYITYLNKIEVWFYHYEFGYWEEKIQISI